MKNMKIITAIVAILLAVGGAFMTQAEEVKNNDLSELIADNSETSQIAYYRTVPNDPATCTVFNNVECNPTPTGTLCQVNISGQMKQLYDSDCASILYRDPVQ